MGEATSPSTRIAGLYAIADLPAPAGLGAIDYASALLGALPQGPGPCALQLRAKGADHAERMQLLRELVPHCRRAGALLIANDDVEAALTVPGVDGVHIGQEDLVDLGGPDHLDGLDDRDELERELSDRSFSARLGRVEGIRRRAAESGRELVIGLSTHTLEQISEAARLPVDYIGFGPIFPTSTKVGADPSVGLAMLRRACALSPHPVVAIGGLHDRSASAALEAGAAAVALISALRRPSIGAIRARTLALCDLLLTTGSE